MGDTDDGTWEFNEAAISVKALLADNLSAGIQLMSRDFGNSGNNELKVDWAFLDYRLNDSVGVRVGKFKKPEGIYNSIRDADAVRTSILLPQGIYNERVRDINIAIQGVGLYGFADLAGAGSLDYVIYLGNQPVDKNEPIIKDALLGGFYGITNGGSIEFKYSAGTQLFWNTPITGFRLGASMNTALIEINGTNQAYPWFQSNITEEELKIPFKYILSAEYQRENWTFTAEYMIEPIEANNSPIGGTPTPMGFPSGGEYDIETESYYVQLTYQLSEKWQIGSYYSWSYGSANGVLNRNDPAQHLKDWALSAKHAINEWWVVKAEFHLFQGYQGVEVDESGVFEKDWNLIALKSTISF